MSVHVRTRSKGRKAYQVLWRDEAGQQRSATFRTKREAEQRDREVQELRERGRFGAIDAGSESLGAAIESWWTDHVEPTVSLNTRKVYATCLDRYLLPRLGKVPIRDIDPAAVIGLQRDLREAGVGHAIAASTAGPTATSRAPQTGDATGHAETNGFPRE
jgi:hypothetical protein